MSKAIYAWSSTEAALEFALELSYVRLNTDDGGNILWPPYNSDALDGAKRGVPLDVAKKNLGAILDLLERTGPFRFATLWKYRSQTRQVSAVALSKSCIPDLVRNSSEYVCDVRGTHAALILENARDISRRGKCRYLQYWYCEDIGELDEDPRWNTKKLIEQSPDPDGPPAPLKRQLSILFSGCSGLQTEALYVSSNTDAFCGLDCKVDYILNLYLD
ncbi:MAG: hypothetical protein AAFV54_10245, partial [Pseudomonadota bacterium]